MSKQKKELFRPLSKSRLKGLIKNHGLQTCIFDRNILVFEWEGLEYLFHLEDGRLLLYSVRIEWDVCLSKFEDWSK